MLSVIALRQIQTIFSVLIGFIMIPIYINFVGAELMGYWLASGFVLALITSIDPGLTRFSTTKIASFLGSKNYEAISKIIEALVLMTKRLKKIEKDVLKLCKQKKHLK